MNVIHPGFLEDLRSSPNGLESAGAYLDWLDDNGVDRNYLRWARSVQSGDLASGGDPTPWITPRTWLTRAYTWKLDPTYVPGWAAYRYGARSVVVYSGFVSRVTCQLRDWIRGGGKWFARWHPVREVSLLGFDPSRRAGRYRIRLGHTRFAGGPIRVPRYRDALPPEVFRLVVGGVVETQSSVEFITFDTFLDARRAAGDAALAWARGGLIHAGN